MDIGVGAFTVINGMALYNNKIKYVKWRGWRWLPHSVLYKLLSSSLLLLLLGLMRFTLLHLISYSTDAAEYGLHWNFFYTLGIVQMLGVVLYYVIPVEVSGYSALLLLSLHEFC